MWKAAEQKAAAERPAQQTRKLLESVNNDTEGEKSYGMDTGKNK